jgi:hypothetical protein
MAVKNSALAAGLLAALTAVLMFTGADSPTRAGRLLILVACLLFIWFPEAIDRAFAAGNAREQGLLNLLTRHVRTPAWLLSGFAWLVLIGLFVVSVA